MKKKHQMNVHELTAYQKQHQYDDPIEAEEGKIEHEKADSQKKRHKSKARIKQQLRNLTAVDEIFELPEEERAAERGLRNAHTHKLRLAGIKKHLLASEDLDIEWED